ncbi:MULTISPECIES: hypothetical protein [Peribacillus]
MSILCFSLFCFLPIEAALSKRKISLIEMPTVDRRPKAVNIPTGERRYKV